jgi:hypothetical protein
MIDHGSSSTWGQVLLDPNYRPKNVFNSNKNIGVLIFGFIEFSPKHMVEAAEPPQPNFGPHYRWFRVIDRSRRSIHDQVDYWEGSLQLLYHKFSLTMIDHGSRRTLGPGPSRFRLRIQKHDLLPLKQDCPTTVCFIKFLPTCTVEAV